MIYGYCRISTPKQSIERQIRNIKNSYPDAILYTVQYLRSVSEISWPWTGAADCSM